MRSPVNILLQTTIPAIADDWNVDRFSLRRAHLASLTTENGEPLCKVTARNREVNDDGNEAVTSLDGFEHTFNCFVGTWLAVPG